MSDREQYIATKDDWNIDPMPEKTDTFILKRHFSKEEIANLRRGHIPDEMEDRWFCYYEDDKLYIHRSWSGICIYIVEFKSVFNRHKVTVNRDENQYGCTDVDEDIEQLNELLGYWS